MTSDFYVRLSSRNRIIKAFKYKILCLKSLYLIFDVKSIHIYFQGGDFLCTKYLCRLEAFLLKAFGFINITLLNLKEGLRELIPKQDKPSYYSKRGFDYVSHVHSTASIGIKFDQVNRSFGIPPSQQHVA